MRTSNRSLSSVEEGEHPVAGRLNLAAPVSIELTTEDGVVPLQRRPPRDVSDFLGARGRIDDVGHNDGCQHPVSSRRRGPPMCADPVDRLVRLVADNPRVVTGGHVDHVVRADLQLGAIVVAYVKSSAHDVARVMEPARRATDHGPHVLRPVPTRVMNVAGNRELTEVDLVGDPTRKVFGLVGRVEVLALDAAHPGNPTTAAHDHV